MIKIVMFIGRRFYLDRGKIYKVAKEYENVVELKNKRFGTNITVSKNNVVILKTIEFINKDKKVRRLN